MTDSRIPEKMTFPVTSMRFMSIFEVDPISSSYTISVPWEDLPTRLAQIMSYSVAKAQASKWGLVTLRSSRPPRMYSSSEEGNALRKLVWEIEDRNMSMEAALSGISGEIAVDFYEIRSGKLAGQIGVSLDAFRFDPTEVKLPDFGESQTRFKPIEDPDL